MVVKIPFQSIQKYLLIFTLHREISRFSHLIISFVGTCPLPVPLITGSAFSTVPNPINNWG